MITFNPYWGGQDVIQESLPSDGLVIAFSPSIVSDVLGAVPQLDSQSSVQSFMQSQFRATAENMNDAGLVFSSTI